MKNVYPNTLREGRNYGIDLLRILSMLMVVMNHLISQGGVIAGTAQYSSKYWVLLFLEILCYCAVNAFVLISGYIGYTTRFQYANILSLWLTVEFYSVGLTLLEKAVFPTNVKLKALLRAALPVSFSKYWFFTAYFCVFFFFPVIIKLVGVLTKKQAYTVMGCALALFSVLPLIPNDDLFEVRSGYGVIWFFVLYYCGALIRKYDPFAKITKMKAFAGYIVCVILSFLPRVFLAEHAFRISVFKIDSLVLTKYSSVTTLFAAIFLLQIFKDTDLPAAAKRIISFFSPLAFSVYLIHHHEFAFKHIIEDRFSFIAGLPLVTMVLCTCGVAVLIFIGCSLADYLRYLLFKLLRVKERLRKAEKRFLKEIW